MKFHLGKVPEETDFHPKEQGWKSIIEPSPFWIQLIAIPVALATVIPLGLIFLSINRHAIMAIPFWGLITVLLFLIPIHEFAHALLHPGWGLTNNTIIAFWPAMMLFYASYRKEMSRNRFLAVFLMPLILLTGLPIPLYIILSVIGIFPEVAGILSLTAVINAAAASGDLIGIFLILVQIPANAVVRNQGWRTYWKLPSYRLY
ncbi:MAG TPA: DUF3267 domain-containing protein [Anaerolineaceae bacterium]